MELFLAQSRDDFEANAGEDPVRSPKEFRELPMLGSHKPHGTKATLKPAAFVACAGRLQGHHSRRSGHTEPRCQTTPLESGIPVPPRRAKATSAAARNAATCSRRAALRAVALLGASGAIAAATAAADSVDAPDASPGDHLNIGTLIVDEELDIDPAVREPPLSSRVFFDFSIGGAPARRIVIGCYGSIVPKTVANFEELARRAPGQGGYVGTKVYRLLSGLTVQMGDVLHNNGRSGLSAGGGVMPPEGYRIKHTVPGIVSMVRGAGGNVDSRFFITTRPGDSGYLDTPGRSYVAFGRVVEGLTVLTDMDQVGSRTGDSQPNIEIEIISCGIL
jgi:cyclophilin family peptidyl-prolyl cis-trans isomerase